jgi:hypothetical protein
MEGISRCAILRRSCPIDEHSEMLLPHVRSHFSRNSAGFMAYLSAIVVPETHWRALCTEHPWRTVETRMCQSNRAMPEHRTKDPAGGRAVITSLYETGDASLFPGVNSRLSIRRQREVMVASQTMHIRVTDLSLSEPRRELVPRIQ